VVKEVAGADTAPVPLAMDWNVFRSALRRSLGKTALWRYDFWARKNAESLEEQEAIV
jgi:hypothetical protein